MYFGQFGGRYVPEMLFEVVGELADNYDRLKLDPGYQGELSAMLKTFAGRPTPLTPASNLSEVLGATVYLKNEGLNMTGAHKMNHCIGQALVAKHSGKTRLIAETGAGQHGLATATIAAKLGMECTIYMGAVDIARQRPNVFYMERLGATVKSVEFGARTLKDAVVAAMQDWISTSDDTHYVIGSALGPDPYPRMNRDFQSVIGNEVKEQIMEQQGKLPTRMYACVGGGSNAIGFFTSFLDDDVDLIAVEAGGLGTDKPGFHAARIGQGLVGVHEGYKSFFLQDGDGNLQPTHSVSAGLDYPGIGPELAYLHDMKRVRFLSATDEQVLYAWQTLARTEGIFAALESSHAVAGLFDDQKDLSSRDVVVVNISGRGDKDLFTVARAMGDESFYRFLHEEIERWDNA